MVEERAREAAEDARREQIILACARRDGAVAAAELQRRHIEAASQLEGPGGAADASYESIRLESVMRLARDVGAVVGEERSDADVGDIRCRRAAADARRSLDEWRARLSRDPPGSNGPPPSEEPSLGPASDVASGPRTCTKNKPWPAIFSYDERD